MLFRTSCRALPLLGVLLCAAAVASPAPMGTLPSAHCVPTLAPRASGPQVADDDFEAPPIRPAFPAGEGPRVVLDEAHGNFHTVDGRYAAFARVLRSDGYSVTSGRDPFDAASLANVDVLVIANALSEEEDHDASWALPTPSAFSASEIDAVVGWVEGGGSLLLIADHMPFPGAASDLAAAFGVLFLDGFATDATCSDDEFLFDRAAGTLAEHPIVLGRSDEERVETVRTFTGQAFRADRATSLDPLLVLEPGSMVLLPSESWEFDEATPRIRADGLLQGATLERGRGRVAVLGEAAMFTAQVSGDERRPMGMNMPSARENPQFLLNVLHWLSGLLPD